MAAATADRARIFAAVSGVEHDGDEPGDFGSRLGLAGCLLRRLFCRLAAQAGFRLERRFAGFFQERQQGIDRLQRMQVEHQAVAIFADRQQRKHLRPDLGLELDDQSNHAGLVAAGTDQLDVGVGLEDLRGQHLQHGIEFDAFEVHHQPLGVLHQQVGVADRLIVFQRHPRVVARRPDAHGKDAAGRRGAGADFRDQQRQAGCGEPEDITPARHVRPLAPVALISAVRPAPPSRGATRNSIRISAAGR